MANIPCPSPARSWTGNIDPPRRPVRLGARTGGTGLGDFYEDRLELKDGIRARSRLAPREVQEASWGIRQVPKPMAAALPQEPWLLPAGRQRGICR